MLSKKENGELSNSANYDSLGLTLCDLIKSNSKATKRLQLIFLDKRIHKLQLSCIISLTISCKENAVTPPIGNCKFLHNMVLIFYYIVTSHSLYPSKIIASVLTLLAAFINLCRPSSL